MGSVLACIVGVACFGIEVGWRTLPEGGTEYVIRVSPEELADLEVGDIIAASDVPAGLPPIRSYRVEVGRGPVERSLPTGTGGPVQTSETPENHAGADPQRPASSGTAASATIPLVFTEPAVPQAIERLPSVPPRATAQPSDQVQGATERDAGRQAEPAEGHREAQDQQGPTNTGEAPVEPRQENSESLIQTLALSGMTASLAAVLYVGWIAWEYRRKYLALLRASRPLTPFEERDYDLPAADVPEVSPKAAHGERADCPSPPESEESSAGSRRDPDAAPPPGAGSGF